MKKYNVGDCVWFAHCENIQVKKLCPICFGKLKVVLILGNDDQVMLPCDFCSRGFHEPSGIVVEYEYISKPEQIIITEVRTKSTFNGEKYEYRTDQCFITEETLFDTEEEALKKCEEIKKQVEEEQSTRIEYIKANVNKSFSWNAGYHLRQIKDNERQIEYHKRKAVLCKARAKDKKEGK